jgi:hypothetical protein
MAGETNGHDAARSKRMGMVSGLVSTGFGVLQLLAPRAFARAIGMPFPPWLIRAVGARDLALGLAMLAQPKTVGWRRTRFVNDLLDTGLIGAAFFTPLSDRRRLTAFAAVAAGVIAFDACAAAAGGRTLSSESLPGTTTRRTA